MKCATCVRLKLSLRHALDEAADARRKTWRALDLEAAALELKRRQGKVSETRGRLNEHQADCPAAKVTGPASSELHQDHVAAHVSELPPVVDVRALAPDWMESALCAQTDPEAFFPEKGGSTREPKSVCGSCTVRAECLDWALEHNEQFGIWGGLSARERAQLKRGQPLPAQRKCLLQECQELVPVAAHGNRRFCTRSHGAIHNTRLRQAHAAGLEQDGAA